MQALDDALFKARDIALRDAQQVGHLLLRALRLVVEPETQLDDALLPRRKALQRGAQQLAVHRVLQVPADDIRLRAQDVGEQQLVPVPVHVERLVKRYLQPQPVGAAQVHEDLVLDAARGIGRQLDLLVRVERVDRLDQADGADGDQILDAHAGVLKLPCDVRHQAQVVLDQRVRRRLLPRLEASKRRHTSFASVDVMPEFDNDIEIEIDPHDIRIDTYRASGAGGQHINKTDSAIRITHLPTNIVVTCQSQRSQIQNREQAMIMLKSKLYQLMLEKQASELNEIKGEQKAIEWGSQIRSYVLHPYSMVKDNRSGYESNNPKAILDGDLDECIYAYLKSMVKEDD